MAEHRCEYCGREFTSKRGLLDHQRAKHPSKMGLTKRGSISRRSLALGIVVLILGLGGIFGLYQVFTSQEIGPPGSAHEHVDFKVYVNGESIDFSQQKYLVRSEYVHVEGGLGIGDVIHKHATGVTLGFFFQTLDISLNSTCLVLDTDESFCNEGDKTLKLFVNGEPNESFGEYEIRDLDKILVSYGDETPEEIQEQLDSITDYASQQ